MPNWQAWACPAPSQIKWLRISRNLLVQEAAEMVLCSRQQWRRYEIGLNPMPPSTWKLFTLLCEKIPKHFEVDEHGNITRHLINPITGIPYDQTPPGDSPAPNASTAPPP